MNAHYNNMTVGLPPQGGGGSASYHPIKVLVRRRWQLFACLLLVCAMALASAFLARPTYHAASQVQVVSDSPDQLGGLTELLGGGGQSDYFKTQCQLITSCKVLSEAARRMSNAAEWDYNDSVYEHMKSRIKVVPINQSRLIEIVGVGETPSEAAAISNYVTAAFVDTFTSDYKAETQRVARRIRSQIVDYDKTIAEKEQALAAYRAEHKIASAAAITREAEARVAALEQELSQLKMLQLDARSRKADLEKLLSTPSLIQTGQFYLPELAGNNQLAGFDSQIRDLLQEEARLARIYLPGHDRLKSVRAKLADLREARYQEMVAVIEKTYQQVREQLDSAQVRQQTLQDLLAQARDRSVELAGYQNQYTKMANELAELVQARRQLDQTLRKFEISESMKEAPVVVVDAAHLPTQPIGLSAEHRAASILLLGLVFSVVFILSVERLTMPQPTESPQGAMAPMGPWNGWAWPPMATPAPTAAETGGAEPQVLGRIGRIEYADGDSERSVATRCRIVHVDASSRASNGFRQVSARLLSRFGRSRQSLLITGSTAGSGKTTCAANLALAIHQAQRQVALVDLNPLSSPLAHAFRYSRKLLDLTLLRDDPSLLDDHLSATDLPGLTILSIDPGSIAPGSEGAACLSVLQASLISRFDWVIYDGGCVGDGVTDQVLQVAGKAVHVSSAQDLDTPDIVMEQIENRGAVCVGYIDNQFYRYAPSRDAVKV